MGTLKESVRHGGWAVKPDRLRKHKGEACESRLGCGFPGVLPDDIDRAIKAQTRHKPGADENRENNPMQRKEKAPI
jgi:hypothetical protein